MQVSRHAVLRYLQRIEPLAPFRKRISQMAQAAVPFRDDPDARWHAETGAIFIVEDNKVITVLGREEAAKYVGRTLANGDKAVPLVLGEPVMLGPISSQQERPLDHQQREEGHA